uniref:Uncharacterized protein n=1 Tax=Ficedula albicollis TaxID=59894 RepID=A0A803VBP8_FICAL
IPRVPPLREPHSRDGDPGTPQSPVPGMGIRGWGSGQGWGSRNSPEPRSRDGDQGRDGDPGTPQSPPRSRDGDPGTPQSPVPGMGIQELPRAPFQGWGSRNSPEPRSRDGDPGTPQSPVPGMGIQELPRPQEGAGAASGVPWKAERDSCSQDFWWDPPGWCALLITPKSQWGVLQITPKSQWDVLQITPKSRNCSWELGLGVFPSLIRELNLQQGAGLYC